MKMLGYLAFNFHEFKRSLGSCLTTFACFGMVLQQLRYSVPHLPANLISGFIDCVY